MHETLKEATENTGVDQRRGVDGDARDIHWKKSLKISESTKEEEWMEMHETLKDVTENIGVDQRRGVDGDARDIH